MFSMYIKNSVFAAQIGSEHLYSPEAMSGGEVYVLPKYGAWHCEGAFGRYDHLQGRSARLEAVDTGGCEPIDLPVRADL